MLISIGCFILMSGSQICYSGATITCADIDIPGVPICQHSAHVSSICETTPDGISCRYTHDSRADVCTADGHQ